VNNLEILAARRPFCNHRRNTEKLEAIRWFARAASIGPRPQNPIALEEIVNELIENHAMVTTRPEDILRLLRRSQAKARSRGSMDSWIKFTFGYGYFASLEFDAVVRPGTMTNIRIDFGIGRHDTILANIFLTGEAQDIIARYRHAEQSAVEIILLDTKCYNPRYSVAQGKNELIPC
jgi:hypothetical protein